MLSKEVSSTIFEVFGMTRPGVEPRAPGQLANTLPTRPMNWSKHYALISPVADVVDCVCQNKDSIEFAFHSRLSSMPLVFISTGIPLSRSVASLRGPTIHIPAPLGDKSSSVSCGRGKLKNMKPFQRIQDRFPGVSRYNRPD